MHVASCAAAVYRSGAAWEWVDVKCGHRLWARSTSWVSIEMTGRHAGRPSTCSASLIQDGSHSRTSWHLMAQVWGGHYWWQRGETSVCSNYVKYLKSFSAWSNFVHHHLPTMKHLSVTEIHKKMDHLFIREGHSLLFVFLWQWHLISFRRFQWAVLLKKKQGFFCSTHRYMLYIYISIRTKSCGLVCHSGKGGNWMWCLDKEYSRPLQYMKTKQNKTKKNPDENQTFRTIQWCTNDKGRTMVKQFILRLQAMDAMACTVHVAVMFKGKKHVNISHVPSDKTVISSLICSCSFFF